eukprot:CAMPEP_0201887110 /NCGR_PEP_ID=MMETSP0902-20130614/24109_1 /ASSEMBLY_ACC=CAM_ASM_000551 /TAXON_ID=420261 /ORGANISM="Thalassiosira antarctica, Strain CCMP982" /LENGTH=672 /DNA_ID=CAMNT_0048416923 /DNA_START=55 /DNA_END=2073 /DNA_ORIENTATION=+
MMKRPLSTPKASKTSSCRRAAFTFLLLPNLLSFVSSQSTFVVTDGIERKKLDFDTQCLPLLSKAVAFDGDGSGGLDRTEFTQFWNDGLNGNADVSTMYDTLLCECHNSFDLDWKCCDDTATQDDDGDDDNDFEIWTEVSLVDFDSDKPGKWEKHYHKQFCKMVDDAMLSEGILLVVDESTTTSSTVWEPSTTTEEATTTSTTTTEEPTTTTKTTEEPITTTTTTKEEPATTTTTMEDMSTTTSTSPEEPTATTTATATEEATTTTTTTTTAEEATSSSPKLTEVVSTNAPEDFVDTNGTSTTTTTTPTSTTTSTTTTSTATSTTSDWSLATTTPEQIVEHFTLTFLASANGNVDADSGDINGIIDAFWRVSLDVLEEMNIDNSEQSKSRGMLDNVVSAAKGVVVGKWSGVGTSNTENNGSGERRQLWNFGLEAAVYFEGVVLDVEDVDCPSGLTYAAEGAPCLQFTYTLTPLPGGPLTTSDAATEQFTANFYYATNNNGDLYYALLKEHPDTEIVGMGSPGKGIPYEDASNTNQVVMLGTARTDSKSVAASGFPVGGFIGIAVAVALSALLMMAIVVRKRRNEQKRQLDDSNLSEDIEANEVNADAVCVEDWLDEEHDEAAEDEERRRRQTSPASSLAAMGVASTVATRLSTGDTEVMMFEKQAWSKNEPVV